MYKQYQPAGRCIYCGNAEESLSKEHIIPFALGGTLTLPRASCEVHRDLTSLLERRVAQEMYGVYRDVQGIQSRHKKRREERANSKQKIAGTNFDGSPCEVEIPIKDLPKLHISIHLPVPQAISGEPLAVGAVGSYVKAQNDPVTMQRLLQKYNKKTLEFTAEIQVEIFLRVLAKIAHAYAVAEYGLNAFKACLLPIINGTSNNLLQYVGSLTPKQEQSKDPLSIGEVMCNGTRYLVVSISLHQFPQFPRYEVVAGTL